MTWAFHSLENKQADATCVGVQLAGKGALFVAKGAATRAAVTKSAHGHDQKTVAAILFHGGKLHKVSRVGTARQQPADGAAA
jgi:hypothetical protein